MFQTLISWLKPLVHKGKSLIYFASGTFIKEEYYDLPFENVFLIDSSFKQNKFISNKIICLKLDSLDAVYLFKQINIKIDCFVGLNEGLYEGGGLYPINSDSFLGYCYPVLADAFIHIGCRDYYSENKFVHLRKHFLDLPYENKKLIDKSSSNYISPQIFSELGNQASVTLLKNKSKREHKFQVNNLIIHVKHDSIWNFSSQLDASFVRYDNSYQKNIIEKFELNVFPIENNGINQSHYKKYDIDEIIDLCIANKWNCIGIVPTGSNYIEMIESISKKQNIYPKKINFYHLNKNDYKSLYKMQ